MTPLSPEQLYTRCDSDSLPGDSTEEIENLPGLIGQERAIEAVAFASASSIRDTICLPWESAERKSTPLLPTICDAKQLDSRRSTNGARRHRPRVGSSNRQPTRRRRRAANSKPVIDYIDCRPNRILHRFGTVRNSKR
jgi:hypothetical protein